MNFCLRLDWKNFNVNLEMVEAYLKLNHSSYVANQAAAQLELYFSEFIDETEQEAIVDYWDSLTEMSEEATSYVSQSDIQQAIESLKQSALLKTWDTMTIAERKIVMGMTPTKAELIAEELL